MVDTVNLHISTIDSEQSNPNTFYIHPKRLPLLFVLKDVTFESCLIDYTPIDFLTSIHFAYILRTLKSEATIKVVIHQPITVMQDYDAKQVEANAKLAGFQDFETTPDSFKDHKSGKTFNTVSVNFVRPVKAPKKFEIEVTTTTKNIVTNTKKGSTQPDKVTTATTTTTSSNKGKNNTSTKIEVETNKNPTSSRKK
jgi:hypothetical protein